MNSLLEKETKGEKGREEYKGEMNTKEIERGLLYEDLLWINYGCSLVQCKAK